ncbi:hypothetical protein MKX03_012271, partial [Papaver bracteatum]
ASYLKGAAEMYEDGVLVTVDQKFLVDSHIYLMLLHLRISCITVLEISLHTRPLTAESSIKLDEILSPNPLYRLRAVLILEVSRTRDQIPAGVKFGIYIQSDVVLDSVKADVQLPEGDEVSMISVGESEGSECNETCMEKELHDLLGGSYVDDELTIDLASGTRLNLHMLKMYLLVLHKADKEFTVKLVSLVRDIIGVIKMHKDLNGRMKNQVELIKGRFIGIKVI